MYDREQDTLTYSWEVSEGTVDETGTWIVPTDVTSAKVVIRVSDGTNRVSAEKKSTSSPRRLNPIPYLNPIRRQRGWYLFLRAT